MHEAYDVAHGAAELQYLRVDVPIEDLIHCILCGAPTASIGYWTPCCPEHSHGLVMDGDAGHVRVFLYGMCRRHAHGHDEHINHYIAARHNVRVN